MCIRDSDFPGSTSNSIKACNSRNHSHECHDVLFMGLWSNGLCDGDGTLSALCFGIPACSAVVSLRSVAALDCPMTLGHTKLDPRFLVCLPPHSVGNRLKPLGIERLEM